MAQITDSADLAQHVTNEAERLEEIEDWDEIGELDVQYRTDGQRVSRVNLTVTTGGPHIEVEATNNTVIGYWAGERFATIFSSDVVRQYGEYLAAELEARL